MADQYSDPVYDSDCDLSIRDLVDIMCQNNFPFHRWHELGLKLHINPSELSAVGVNHPNNVEYCFIQCLDLWLRGSYDLDSYGKPTMELLETAVKGMGLAWNIASELYGPVTRVLEPEDLTFILESLREAGFLFSNWFDLGLHLGISNSKLEAFKFDHHGDDERCLIECLAYCINQGSTTITSLSIALKYMRLSAVADHINISTVSDTYYGLLLYYEKQELAKFTVTKDRDQLIDIRSTQAEIHVVQDIAFRFKNDYIELIFDAPQHMLTTGWHVEPHTIPCRIFKGDVDGFGKDDCSLPPSCSISVKKSSDAVPSLQYAIPVRGAVNQVTLYVMMPTLANPVLQITDLVFVYEALIEGNFSWSKWLSLGLYLGLKYNELRVIESDERGSVQRCVMKCLSQWLHKDRDRIATLISLCDALEKIGQIETACYIRQKRFLQNTSSDKKGPLLEIDDLSFVVEAFREAGFPFLAWFDLGLYLGLSYSTLHLIEFEYQRDYEVCLRKCLLKWLMRADIVEYRGDATMISLCVAIEKAGFKIVADRLKKFYLQDTSFDEKEFREKKEKVKKALQSQEVKQLHHENEDEQKNSVDWQKLLSKEDFQDLYSQNENLKKSITILKKELNVTNKKLAADDKQVQVQKEHGDQQTDMSIDEHQVYQTEIENLKRINSELKEELDMTKKKAKGAFHELTWLQNKTHKPEDLDQPPKDLNQPLESHIPPSLLSLQGYMYYNRQRLMIILIYTVFLSFIIYTSYDQDNFIAPLPGVEVAKSTNIVVPGGHSTKFILEEYGLVIDCPADALSNGLFAVINIRLSVSGPYVYPESKVISAFGPVYWISSSKEFLNPITLGIRHYASQEAIIKVYRADDNPRNMSYFFEEVDNVTVSGNYVYFLMDHFCGLSYNTSFCGTLLYQKSSTHKYQWDYNFIIHQCSRDVVKKNWSVEFEPITIVFEDNVDEIELDLKSILSQNWKAVGKHFPLSYACKDLLMEKPTNNMQFSLQWQRNDSLPTTENLFFSLKGTRKPQVITITTQSIEPPSFWEKYQWIFHYFERLTNAWILLFSIILFTFFPALKNNFDSILKLWTKIKDS